MATIVDALMERQQRPVLQQQVQRSPLIAQALLANGMDGQPVDSFWESAGKLAQTFAGTKLQGQQMAQEEAKTQAQQDELDAIIEGMGLDPSLAALIRQLPLDQQPDALLPLFGGGGDNFGPIVTGEDAKNLGLDPMSAWQQGPDQQWHEVGGGGVNVSTTVAGNTGPQIGTIPQGYQVAQDPKTGAYRMEPIPGGPAAQEAADAATAADEARTRELTQANIVVQDIGRALDAASFWTTGFAGARLDNLEGTPAYDLKALTDTIRANVGFNQLQQMREASPTGGALGQVSEQENILLQSVLGSLDTSQSETQFRQNLERLREVFLDIIHGGPNADAGGQRNWWVDDQGNVNVGQPPGPEPGAEGWIDMGNGVRIRAVP